ncbi:hypothetical protein ABE525_05605 [Pseudomonas wadenswilerensis]|uniref:hypothetical protein n=1 Tax=Pseudomonas wadenswilerensis TaxID=1785161 RepID=UPI00320AC380
MHHRTIEFKDWKRPVDQGKTLEFHQKIKNIAHDILGIVVSRSGYQAGVDKVAARHNISLITADDLPSLPELVSRQLIVNGLHEPDLLGESFWVIAEQSNSPAKYSTGSYYVPMTDGRPTVPIFL